MLAPPPVKPGKSAEERLQWWNDWVWFLQNPVGHYDVVDGEKVYWGEHLFAGWETHKELKRVKRAVGVADETFTDSVEYSDVEDVLTWLETIPRMFLIHVDLLSEHLYVKGPTGAGKTSLAIMPIVIQLIRGSKTPDGARTRPRPILFLDFKHDQALFQTIKMEAEARGQRFRFFTIEKDQPTHLFNPFRGFDRRYRTVPQLCQLVLDTLGLNFGRTYGRGYFTERSRYLLSLTLKRHPRINTFQELHVALQSTASGLKDQRAKSDAFELLSVIETLTEYPQLVTSPDLDLTAADNVIFMPRVIRDCEVVYASLPAALESISVGEIGKLFLFNLRVAAQDWKRSNPSDPRNIVLVADEAQHLVGDNMRGILQDARSFGISTILSNQSLKDLKSPSGADLAPTIMTNSRVKFFFNSPSETECFVYVERGKGFTKARQYPERGNPWLRVLSPDEFGYHVRLTWPMSREEYKRREALPWPGWDEVPGGNPWPNGASAAPSISDVQDAEVSVQQEFSPVRDDERARQITAIKALFTAEDRGPQRQDDVIQDLLFNEHLSAEEDDEEE